MLGQGPRGVRRRLLRVQRALARAFAALPGLRRFRGYSGVEQRALRRDEQRPTRLDRRLDRSLRDAAAGASAVTLLADGAEALSARLALADLAGRSLDIQTYIWELDRTGRRALSHLLAAADRGVRVRLLLDDTTTFRDELSFVALDRHPNAHVRFFNPFQLRTHRGFLRRFLEFLVDFRRLHRRMHVKSWIADAGCAILGGRNIADPYYATDSDLNFRDLDLMLAGAAVGAASDAFDAHWNSRWAVPVPHLRGKGRARLGRLRRRLAEFAAETEAGIDQVAARRDLDAALDRLVVAPVDVVADPPEKVETETPSAIAVRLAEETAPLRATLDIESAYLVLPDAGIDLLANLARRGVRVRLLTNSLATTDVVAAHAGYSRLRRRLLAAGVELHELRPGSSRRATSGARPLRSRASLHAKAAAFDGERAFVGSLNLDARSIRWNTEIGVFVASASLARELTDELEAAFAPAQSWRVEAVPGERSALRWIGSGAEGHAEIADSEPAVSLGRRLLCALLERLPIRDLL